MIIYNSLTVKVDDHIPSGEQMEADRRLLAEGTGHELILRFYGWNPPAVSLGRHQVPDGLIDTDSLKARQWIWVHRPTGGGAVLHHGDMTFSLFIPRSFLRGPTEAYDRMKTALGNVINSLGVDLTTIPAKRVDNARGPVCFLGGHQGEVFQNGGKTAGIALRWTPTNCLLQVSLLLEDNADHLADCLMPFPGSTKKETAEALRAGFTPLASIVPSLPGLAFLRELIAVKIKEEFSALNAFQDRFSATGNRAYP